MNKQKVRMDISNRAKQFMPFAALKGLPEALAERERITVPKAELSEDITIELDRRLQQIRLGQFISIVYFHQDQYQEKTGSVRNIDSIDRFLLLNETIIYFSDILDLTPIS